MIFYSIDPDNVYHVLPVNDLDQHTEQCEFRTGQLPYCPCKCQPNHKEVGNEIHGIVGMVVVHNSFDGREGVEWVNEILNN